MGWPEIHSTAQNKGNAARAALWRTHRLIGCSPAIRDRQRQYRNFIAIRKGYNWRMTKPLVPRALLDPVVNHFRPQRVILFGSRARGESTRDSDIDLLVVVDDDTPAEKLTWQAGYESHGSNRAADVFPIRAETFERERVIANTLAAEADADGIVVYGAPKGVCMKAPDPRARWEAVDGWLAVGQEDRRVAAACIAMEPPLRGIAAFHCPQAVEKLLKGFLTLAGKRGRKTHSPAELGAAAAR